MKGLHRKLFRDLKTLGVQIFTIALLIVGGLSVLVSSWSSYLSLQTAKESFYEKYRFADVFAEVVRAPESLQKQISEIPGVELIETRLIKDGLVEVPHQVEPALGHFISWRGLHQNLNLIHLRQGRMPQKSFHMEVVVHEAFAIAHHLKIGDFLKIQLGGKQRILQISGIGLSPEYVYALSPVAPLPDDKHFGVFWMRHQDLQSLMGMDGAFNSLHLKVAKQTSLSEFKRQLDILLAPYGNIQSYDRSRQLSHVFVEDEIRQQRVMALVMPTIFLSVAMFILNIILSRLISLHRPQIATLKSLGYSAWKLTGHYFQLVTLILLSGILPSLVIGAWIGHWYAGRYAEFFRFPSIDFTLSMSAIVLSIFVGLISGWVGAAGSLLRVFSLRPAEALRPPNPPHFQKGLFEKLGLSRRLSLFSKMTLRSLLFRPLRLFLGITGMALALAILINGSFWTDVIDAIKDRQFYQMRREDLTVRLLHPANSSVFVELQHIPGIMMTEGERSVPVRLQYKNFKKEIALLGWESKSQMSRLLDEKNKPIQPQKGGVLLSRYFQIEYNMRIGDQVEFKVLQGAQSVFTVPVLGFVEDMIGQQAYAIKNDLHHWLKELPVVDTIQLKIDPKFADSIYLNLKARPEVAAINIRQLLLKSFTETVADMIVTFTVILYAFAVAIAGAVMYNATRISFSERGWELASLRILGFDVASCFNILWIEIGLQVLLALIPGLALGYVLSYLSTHMIHNDTFKFPLVIDLSTYGGAVLMLMLTYLLNGLFLYRQVRLLRFSEALKARE